MDQFSINKRPILLGVYAVFKKTQFINCIFFAFPLNCLFEIDVEVWFEHLNLDYFTNRIAFSSIRNRSASEMREVRVDYRNDWKRIPMLLGTPLKERNSLCYIQRDCFWCDRQNQAFYTETTLRERKTILMFSNLSIVFDNGSVYFNLGICSFVFRNFFIVNYKTILSVFFSAFSSFLCKFYSPGFTNVD